MVSGTGTGSMRPAPSTAFIPAWRIKASSRWLLSTLLRGPEMSPQGTADRSQIVVRW
jgi:hypothetical protein